MVSLEYCLNWATLVETKFDPREMKKLYYKEICGGLNNRKSLPYSIKHLIQAEANSKSL